MNFFTNTSIIIFLMILSKIEYSIGEENDSQLDDILDENVQDMAVDYNYRGLDTTSHNFDIKFEVLKEVPIVEQPTMAEPEEVEKFRKLLEAWLWVVVSVVVFLALCLVICMTWLVSLLRLK